MGYKNKTYEQYQNEYYLENKLRKKQYYIEYYKNNMEYIRVYNYLRYHNNKIEQERDLKKVYVIQNNFHISLEE
jgi:hypothetical protein